MAAHISDSNSQRPITKRQMKKERIREAFASPVEVQIIPAKADENGSDGKRKQRVCAYCRVSTDMDTQVTSYELQVQNYTEMITGNDEWELVDIYADEGISGTSLKHRDNFNRMIADCKEGKLNIPLLKYTKTGEVRHHNR